MNWKGDENGWLVQMMSFPYYCLGQLSAYFQGLSMAMLVSGRVTFIVIFTLRRLRRPYICPLPNYFLSKCGTLFIQPKCNKETLQSSNLQAKCTIRLRIFSFREEPKSFEEATEDEKRALAALGSAEALDEVLETMEQILSAEGQNVGSFRGVFDGKPKIDFQVGLV